MLTFLSVLIIIGSVALIIGSFIIPKTRQVQRRNSMGVIITETVDGPAWGQYLTVKNGFIGIVVGVLLLIANTAILDANEGTNYYVLSPTGSRSVITTPGIKFITPWSKVQAWSKFYDVKAMKTNGDGNYVGDTEGIEGIIPNGVSVRFIDKVTADIYVSLRFQMPDDEQSFIRLVETYRHPQNLINNTLIPTVQEQLRNVTFMYTAEEYVSGGATDYRMTIEDGLKNGGFVVEKVEVQDTIYSNTMTVDSLTTTHNRSIKEIRSLTKNEKVLQNGIPKRIPHEINVNKIITASVIVDNVILDKSFEEKLTLQRDISAQKIIEISKVETARAAQQRIQAEGERDKTQEKMKREIEAVDVLIAEETKIKKEESKRQLEEIALKTSKLAYERRKVDAEAKKLELQLADGLSEAEQYKIDKEVEARKAEAAAIGTAFQNLQTVIIGGDGESNSLIESILGAEMAKGMIKKEK